MVGGTARLRERVGVGANEDLPAYAWPGGYPILYLDQENNTLCPKCANDPDGDPPASEYYVHYEGAPDVCDQCGAETESAYGDPDGEPKMEEEDYELVQRGDALYLVEMATGRVAHGPAEDRPALKKLLDASSYFPNVWTISDHGNECLVTDWT